MTDEVELRKTAIRLYQYLSLAQLLAAVGSLVCSGLALKYGLEVRYGVPYYSGGFIIGTLLLLSGLLAFRVYNKGPAFSVSEQAEADVKCALNCHRITSMLMFLCSLLGLAIIWMYGMCFQLESICSYSDNISQNRTLAICSFTFGVVGIVTAGLGICLIRKYGSVFGFVMNVGGRQGFVDYYGGRCRTTNGNNNPGGSDVMNHLRQQNEILQQQLDRQRQQQQQYGPFVPPEGPNCYTNMAFIPPELPPYSPSEVGGSTISPYDPPPPYSVTGTKEPDDKNV